MNEVCQLNVSDIQKTDGIWALNLNADSDDKSIKTQAGNRIIPLHPKLLNLGLLDYMKQIILYDTRIKKKIVKYEADAAVCVK